MMLSLIKQDDMKLITKILSYNMSSYSREDEISIGFVNASYKMCGCKITNYNLEKIKKIKYAIFIFRSLI